MDAMKESEDDDLWYYSMAIGGGVVILCCFSFLCLVLRTWRKRKDEFLESTKAIATVMDTKEAVSPSSPSSLQFEVMTADSGSPQKPGTKMATTDLYGGEGNDEPPGDVEIVLEGTYTTKAQCTSTKGEDEECGNQLVANWLSETVGLSQYVPCFIDQLVECDKQRSKIWLCREYSLQHTKIVDFESKLLYKFQISLTKNIS